MGSMVLDEAHPVGVDLAQTQDANGGHRYERGAGLPLALLTFIVEPVQTGNAAEAEGNCDVVPCAIPSSPRRSLRRIP